MKVVMLGPYPESEEQVLGGPEAVVLCLLKHLVEIANMELHVLTLRPDLAAPTMRQVSPDGRRTWTVHSLPRKRWGRFTFHIRERLAARAKIAELKPDILHAQGSGIYAAAALDSGLPNVVTVHGISFREARIYPSRANKLRGWLDGVFERQTLGRAKNVISISPYVKTEFDGIVRARTFDIENPVEEPFFDSEAVLNPQRILFAGRLIRRKGVHHLLQAFESLASRFPQAELFLAGEGNSEREYANALRAYAEDRALPVHFLGPLDIAEMASEYRACGLVVLPSEQETAPVVIEEAMAMGRPVVASAVGGVPYMVNHEATGLLVKYGDVEELAAAMSRLLSSPELAAQMGAQGRQEAENRFRGQAVAEQTHAAYRQILAQRGRLA